MCFVVLGCNVNGTQNVGKTENTFANFHFTKTVTFVAAGAPKIGTSRAESSELWGKHNLI